VTRVTRDPRLLTSHDSRLLQFSLQWAKPANGPTVPNTYYLHAVQAYIYVAKWKKWTTTHEVEGVNGTTVKQDYKSYKTHEAQSDLSKTATPIYQPYPVIPVRSSGPLTRSALKIKPHHSVTATKYSVVRTP